MANPQLENGYTRIANELMDAIGQLDLNGTEYKVLLCVMRYTYGFQRKSHKLSASFISEWGNCSERTVKRALKRLIALNILLVTNEGQKGVTSVLELNKNFDLWRTGEQMYTSDRIDTSDKVDTTPVTRLTPLPVTRLSPKKRNNINKKSKEKYIGDFFEKVWQQYPKKKGKNAVSKKAMQELYEAGEDKVMAAIEAYCKEVEGREEKYILNGSTFFNGRWKDYVPLEEKSEPAPQQQDLDEPEEYRGLTAEEYQELRKLGIINEHGGIDFSIAIDCGKYEILRRAGIAV